MRMSDWSSDVGSSDLDATYPVWQVEVDNYAYKGRFAVEGGAIDPVTGTDGLSAWSGPIGPFPEGALAMHDTDDGAGQQNFKLVDWRQVRRALGLERTEETTSELQSLMSNSDAFLCLKKKTHATKNE